MEQINTPNIVEMQPMGGASTTYSPDTNNSVSSDTESQNKQQQQHSTLEVNYDLASHIQEYMPTEKTGMYVSAKNLSFYVINKKAGKHAPESEKRIYLLNDFNFYLKPGRIVLLMGAPSSGKSVLMKLLANRYGAGKVEGELLYNGHLVDDSSHQRDTIYVPQEDRHIALLTVKETMDFSADCNMGAGVDASVKQERVELILNQLGLSHTKNTIVGNEFARGISGGQKRRVTIAAEFTKCPNLILMDEPTTGLDSATAYSVVSKVKTISTQAKASSIISLLQPSPELTNLFDDVMLIGEHGKLNYFGPLDQVLNHFRNIGFQPLPDQPLAEFMQEVLEDPAKYLINKEGLDISLNTSNSNVPALKLDQFYKDSTYYTKSIENVNNLISKDEKLIDSSMVDNVRSPIWYEIKLCLERHWKIMKITRKEIFTRFFQAVFMGFVVGSLFFQLGHSQADARNRFGLLYFSMVLHIWSVVGSVEEFYQMRNVFYDQTDGKYYRPFPYFITLVISKIPVAFIEATLFSSVCYWIAGFRPTGDGFIVFVLCMMLTNIVSQGVFQMVSSVSDSQLVTSMITPAIVIFFMVFSGYLLPRPNIPGWWIWMHFLSPLKYVLDALASNEMHGQTFGCTDAELIPPVAIANAFYNGSRVCAQTQGDEFLHVFGMSENLYFRWIDIVIAIGFALTFFTVFFFGVKYIRFETKKPPKVVKNAKNKIKKDKKDKRDTTKYVMKGCYMTFEDLSYSVPVKRKNVETGKNESIQLTLLNKINGFVKPGMTALMGPSGAGKSTLLDVLSKRKNAGTIGGCAKVNGVDIADLVLTRFTAYVEQQDILSANLTVREAIEFSANCRLPTSFLHADRAVMIDDILKVLNLTKLQHTKIGPNPTMGISLANRKKVSIGIELASDPHLLFLDEPTSGLDSAAALKVMNCVRRIAQTGRTVICTIHQPSQEIFEQFDQLLLLSKGQVIYFGDTGDNSSNVLNYFASIGYELKDKSRNPSDFILEIAEQHMEGQDPIEAYTKSQVFQDTVQQLSSNSVVPASIEAPNYTGQYAAPATAQLRELLKRCWYNIVRRPTPVMIRFFRSIIPAVVVGTLFLRLQSDQAGARNKLAMVFLSFLFGGMASIAKIPLVIEDRAIYYREYNAGTYPFYLYQFAAFVTDIPLMMMTAFCFWIPFFFLTGLDPGHNGWKFFFSLLTYLLMIMCYDGLATIMGLVLPTIPIASLFCGMGLNFLGLFGGFFIDRPHIPQAWQWMHFMTFTRYGLETLGVTEMQGQTFDCPDNKGAVPIDTGNGTIKYFCPIQSGQVIIDRYGFMEHRQFINIAILFGYVIGFFLVACLAIRFIKHSRK